MATQTILMEMEIQLSARMERTDYGVAGSPVWSEAEDVELDSVHMFGKFWSEREILNHFGKKGGLALINLILELERPEDWDTGDDE
jgi:hypothetical protein